MWHCTSCCSSFSCCFSFCCCCCCILCCILCCCFDALVGKDCEGTQVCCIHVKTKPTVLVLLAGQLDICCEANKLPSISLCLKTLNDHQPSQEFSAVLRDEARPAAARFFAELGCSGGYCIGDSCKFSL